MSAASELLEFLLPDEKIEAVVFGAYSSGLVPRPGEQWKLSYREPSPLPVPFELRGKVLTWRRAKKYMVDWAFEGGFGAEETYATYIWTNMRVIWIHEYDGSTQLSSVPRHPIDCMPELSGSM